MARQVDDLLSVPEAARALRIGRATAYELAHAFLDSRGEVGLPVLMIGGTMRVPLAALERAFADGGIRGSRRHRDRKPTATAPAVDEPAAPPAAERPKPSHADESKPAQLSLFDLPEA